MRRSRSAAEYRPCRREGRCLRSAVIKTPSYGEMHMRKRHVPAFAARVTYALVGVAAFVLSIGTAAADNGVETTELEWVIPSDNPIWIECINEFVYGPVRSTVKYHVIETPAGSAHALESAHTTAVFTGLSSGRVWLGESVDSYTIHILKVGEVFPMTNNTLFKPLNDGPILRLNGVTMIKVDEDGNFDLLFSRAATGEETRCLGPNS